MKTGSSAIAKELCDIYDGEHVLNKHSSHAEFLDWANGPDRGFFSFAGVRNPLDVVVSRYLLRKAGRGARDRLGINDDNLQQIRFIRETGADFNAYFKEFVINRKMHYLGEVPIDWRNNSFRAIDYIYRFEDLQQEMALIFDRLGLNMVRPIPAFNQTASKKPYLAYYNRDTLALACRVFGEYLDYWNYEPSLPHGRLRRLTRIIRPRHRPQ